MNIAQTDTYNHIKSVHRKALAQSFLSCILNAGFIEAYMTNTTERVFYRLVDPVPNTRIMVFSSVVGVGGDAEVRILNSKVPRVVPIYRVAVKHDIFLSPPNTVKLVGTHAEITQCLLTTMRQTYKQVLNISICRSCSAPMSTKQGKFECAAQCGAYVQII